MAALGVWGINVSEELSNALINFIAIAGPPIAAIWVAIKARKKVTPLKDPRNEAGQPLTPDTEAA